VQSKGAAARPAIDAALGRAVALIDESGAESFRPRWHLAAAECAQALGDGEAAGRELRAAQQLSTALGMDELAEHAARELMAVEGAEVA
jgi:hypothetical protein